MADIYIDATNGDDTTGDGSSGTPYASLSKAFTVVAAGDVIKIANTSAQVFATLAFPGIATTSDAWLVIEGWDNGGAQVIENPAGDFTDVGVIEGRITGTLAFVKFKKIKFQNVSITTNSIVETGSSRIYEFCDFNGITVTTGAVISLSTLSTARFCSFRNITMDTAGNGCCLSFSTTDGQTAFNCYFYNVKKGILVFRSRSTVIGCVFDEISVYGISAGADHNIFVNNTIIGDGTTAGAFGISLSSSASEYSAVYNNHIQDFAGTSAVGISASLTHPTTKGTFDIFGNNSFYNNTADTSLGTNFAAACMTDLTANDIVESAEPLVDKAAFNYAKKSTALSYGQTGALFGFNYTTTETSQTTGAVENTLSAGGGETSYVCG
jgi:hypothetical protein